MGASVTDNYSNPGYVFIQNNAVMNAVLGENGLPHDGVRKLTNIVSGGTYCAGCNGSFELSFTTTSVGDANGVFGVGLDVLDNSGYFAFVTFGDGSTDNVLVTGSFFGLTSPQEFEIHPLRADRRWQHPRWRLPDRQPDASAAGAAVPEPTTTALLTLALLGLAATRRKPAAR